MVATALFSGLIGALIASLLTYVIRLHLDRRAVIEAQRRMAYVHLVKISSVIAHEITVRRFVQAAGGNALKKLKEGINEKFDLSHAICAYLAKKLNDMAPEKWNGDFGSTGAVLVLKSSMSTIEESKLSAEQLAELPRDAIEAYSEYLSQLSGLHQSLQIWLVAFERKDASPLTAENLHLQWRTLNLFLEAAKRLRTSLINAGATSNAEAETLLEKQVKIKSEMLVGGLKDKLMIAAAVASLQKAEPLK